MEIVLKNDILIRSFEINLWQSFFEKVHLLNKKKISFMYDFYIQIFSDKR
jgi:hypothetical protein